MKLSDYDDYDDHQDHIIIIYVHSMIITNINQQAADEFNEAALEPCAFCGRWLSQLS